MPAVIFNGNKVKTLKDAISINGKADIISGSVNPTTSAVDAPIGTLYMNDTTGKMYRKNDSGSSTNWTELAGLQDTQTNYISNPRALQNTTGWNLYNDGASLPVDGTGGVVNGSFTWTRNTTTPISGIADFLLSKPGSNVLGHGVAIDFTIDLADRAKVLTVGFDYQVESGTYNTGDLHVYLIADPTGTPQVIQPAGFQIVSIANPLVGEQLACTFQTLSNVSTYRMVIHVANSNTNAYTMNFDNFKVSRQQYSYGSPKTDFQSYSASLTNAGDAVVTYARWAQDGQNVIVEAQITMGSTAPTGTIKISAPPGLTPTTSGNFAIPNSSSKAVVSATGSSYHGIVRYDSSTSAFDFLGGNGQQFWNATVPITWVSGDTLRVYASYQVQGWSSNTLLSDSAATRVIAMRATKSTVQSVPNSTDTVITGFNTPEVDDVAGFNATTGVYTVAIPGDYLVTATLDWANNATGYRNVQILRSGSVFQYGQQVAAFSGDSTRVTITAIVPCVAGQTISMRGLQTSGGNLDVRALSSSTSLNIHLIQGPAQIAASEECVLFARNSSGQSIAHNTATTVTGWTTSIDSFGSFNASTGVYTFASPGRYLVQGQIAYTGTSVTGVEYSVSIMKGATEITIGAYFPSATGSGLQLCQPPNTPVDAVAGDTVSLRAYQVTGGSRNLINQARYNTFSIIKVK